MLISAFVRTVYVPSRIEICPQYESKLYSVISHFSDYLQVEAKLRDLTELSICAYLTDYRRSWSARATNNQRSVLLSIWQDAADRAEFLPLLSGVPNRRKIKKLPEELDPPQAWTVQQIASLIRESMEQRGSVGSIPACCWWPSLFLSIYWTSCRISSMLAVRSADYDGRGLTVRKQKNRRPKWYSLPKSCREYIESTSPNRRKLIWDHPWHPRTIWTKAREIIEAAGLPSPHTGRQLFHRLRRSTITLCWQVDQGIAQRTAGHQDAATTLKHYVDPRMAPERSAADILPDPLKFLN